MSQDPSTLLLFATLQAISRESGPKSLGPAEGICIRRTLGFGRGSRGHRWQSCNWPPDIGGNRATGHPGPLGRFSGSSGTHRLPLGGPEGPKSDFWVPGGVNLDLRRNRFLQFRCAKIRICKRAERLPKHLVLFIPARGDRAPPCLGTLQLYCYLLHFRPSPVSQLYSYLLHFRPSPVRAGPNPSALPTDFACGEL